jgi:hypothetical protein
MTRGDWVVFIAWAALAGLVAYRAYADPAPFDYVTTFVAWSGGIAWVGVIATIRRGIHVRRNLKE